MIRALLSAFSLGFLYFISAIPLSMMAGAPLWSATLVSWLGYSAGGGIVLVLGAPVRRWLFQKMHLSIQPNPKKIFWRMWARYGVFGLGLVAPVTLGPQVAALVLLGLGEAPKKILSSIALGGLFWACLFALSIEYAPKMFKFF